MGRVEALTGHPEPVQALVDAHLAAAAHGPATRDRVLEALTPETCAACYAALLDRDATTPVIRAVNARNAARAATAANEAAAIRRGGAR